MAGWVNQKIWDEVWRNIQIIAGELLLMIILVLSLAVTSWLLHLEWLSLKQYYVEIIEGIHFWY